MNGRRVAIAALVALGFALLFGALRNDGTTPPGPAALPGVATPAASAGDRAVAASARPSPTPEAARVPGGDGAPVDEAARELALQALESGPPSLRLFRCAALARLLSERGPGADRARYQALVTDLDAAIARVRDYPAAVVDESAEPGSDPGTLPTPEAVLQATREEATRVGSRADQWLGDSWARCDQEVQWLEQVRVLLPAPPG